LHKAYTIATGQNSTRPLPFACLTATGQTINSFLITALLTKKFYCHAREGGGDRAECLKEDISGCMNKTMPKH
jgi:hypothetical protein